MKKVTAFVGSAHKGGATYRTARRFLEVLESYGGVHGEIVIVSEYELGVCRGCKVCFDRGEERCPFRDDRDLLVEKMVSADGVVFASPNYSWQMSAIMKIFLDRLAFVFHRPRFFGRTSTSIVVQGMFRGGRIVKDLGFVGGGLGFNVVKGSCSRTLEPMSGKALAKMEETLVGQARRFHARLCRPAHPVPSFRQLAIFRMSRMSMKLLRAQDNLDYAYYREQTWFESDSWYPVRLGPFRKAAGALLDWIAARLIRPPAGNEPAVYELEGAKS